jgi:hypothetical protein
MPADAVIDTPEDATYLYQLYIMNKINTNEQLRNFDVHPNTACEQDL